MVGVLRDKDAESILAVLEPVLDEIVVTRGRPRRARCRSTSWPSWPSSLRRGPRAGGRAARRGLVAAIGTAEAAVAHEEGHGAGVLVTGSVTVVGEARLLLRAPAVDADQGLDQEQEELS